MNDRNSDDATPFATYIICGSLKLAKESKKQPDIKQKAANDLKTRHENNISRAKNGKK